ncbi:hypothetical protein CIW49_24680 [Mycolicibacterium sp. P1-18]|uniref:hypothetical protein n=1 Tax=Mycolicibacterium sp. P1-18 TaxID=2024615 RepID=UPI0011F335E3|nr:hypothetical protein [Mycolicibacterium sp. P1-18]KAA0094741.1 hypothetical protein CIW49_24680 [Mycolicibacterium sp. P1-18]
MTGISDEARIDEVAPGDLVSLDVPGDERPGERQYKVVFVAAPTSGDAPTFAVTLETDDGETFDVDLPGDTVVRRSMESKWESAQSPTPTED